MRRRARCRGEDRGAVTVWFATASLVMIMLVGLAVDVGGKVHTQQRARSVAAQAARVGAQEVAGGALIGGSPQVNPVAARAAALRYLSAAGVAGSVRVTGTSVHVTTTDIYDCTFLGIVGLEQLRVTGRASARFVRSQGGVER